ncbi:MAG: bifunctional methylenetetrahydrofolate dehydrogenase/methenyltetrahydrofolate cyclohydrolase FolD [Candidatus Margulisbacteria bacterium]|nr:bifunctional methylenetetrahydrofolate dehydrogenase/methenyltetrahydrofolate cyclohydrolase FolD [Candidatus Margulisiibacteriota bacterium]
MTPHILAGRPVSDQLLKVLKEKIHALKEKSGKTPGLAVILVGDNPASQTYVSMKKKTCKELGIASFDYDLAPEDGEETLIKLLNTLNNDDKVQGILLQLPLPKGFDDQKMLSIISPQKDVDGFHPENLGKLLAGLPTLKSCTPFGVWELMKFYNIDPEGKHVVILGRSNIVGKPLAAILMQKNKGCNATVTVCHSRTSNLEEITQTADIVIAAMGKPMMVTSKMIKPGAVVIDVGINRVADPEKGYKLVGDVDFEDVSKVASAITPVPGGIGPMTIAMLMTNTVDAFCALNDLHV